MINTSKNILLLSSAIFAILISLSLTLLIDRGSSDPERPRNVPETATWKGGVDGGFWFDVVTVNGEKKMYRFKIYNDYNGELVMDADFKKNNDCSVEYPMDKSIVEKIELFDFQNIIMSDNCFLQPIGPLYN